MTWQKVLITVFLFYIFALLQNSFFSYFSVFGAVPNLVFILFFLLVFFAKKNQLYQVLFPAICAGFFLDMFSYSYFGKYIILLLIIAILIKKTQSLLKSLDDNFPFIYFLPLFLIYYIIFEIFSSFTFNLGFLATIVYNLIVASGIYFVFKKYGYTKQ